MRATQGTLPAIVFGAMLLAGIFLSTMGKAQQQSSTPAESSKLTQQDIARMLPATDMGASEGLPEGHPVIGQSGSGPATAFDSAPIPHNPLAPDATPVGAKACATCHSLENVHASHSIHVKAFRAGASGSGPEAACESCHGPGSTHIQNPTSGLIISFTSTSQTPIATQTSTCLGCHAGGARHTGQARYTNHASCRAPTATIRWPTFHPKACWPSPRSTKCARPATRMFAPNSTAVPTCLCRKGKWPVVIATIRMARSPSHC